MKVRTAGKPQFPGDTFKRIEVELRPGCWYTVFGVAKHRGRWKNDTYSGYDYATLTEAKHHALEIAVRDLNHV